MRVYGVDVSLRDGPVPRFGRRVSEAVDDDGRLVFSLDHDAARGWRLWAADDGAFCVAPDGRTVVTDGVGPLLFDQVLPLAAVLQGREVLHASAVTVGGEALVFTGLSQAGKSSLAIRCVLEGAEFLTDDVLALERVDERVFAHPGPPRSSLREPEWAALSDDERTRLRAGEPGADGRVPVHPPMALPAEPRVVVFLDRATDAAELRLHPVSDPRLLLAATFNFVVTDPERQIRQLDVCAALARQATLVRAEIPPGVTSAEVARACLRLAGAPA